MVAFNDVTKRAITTIDLKKAVSLHDDQERNMRTPASHASSSSYDDEFDGPCGVEKSFKLLFPGNQRISFFADTEADKGRWYVHFNLITTYYSNAPFQVGNLRCPRWSNPPQSSLGRASLAEATGKYSEANRVGWLSVSTQPPFRSRTVAHGHDICFPIQFVHLSMLSMLSTCSALRPLHLTMYK